MKTFSEVNEAYQPLEVGSMFCFKNIRVDSLLNQPLCNNFKRSEPDWNCFKPVKGGFEKNAYA